MSKLSEYVNEEWTPLRRDAVFQAQQTTGPSRLAISTPCEAVELVIALSNELTEPLYLLWVLHTPQEGVRSGRYESPPISRDQASALLRRFAGFFERDARSDIWLLCPDEEATIVYESHDLIYAYGPLQVFERALRSRGFSEGTVAIPSPHAHGYQGELSACEQGIANALPWRVLPLEPGDN